MCSGTEDLKVKVRCFVEVCKRKYPKFNVNKSKVIALGEEEGSDCEVFVDRTRMKRFQSLSI